MFEFYHVRDIEKNFEEFDKFKDVLNLFELKSLLNEFITNGKYVFIIENIDFIMFDTLKKSKEYSTLINNAYEGLNSLKYWVLFSIMDFSFFSGVYSIIVYSLIVTYGRMLNNDERESIIFSDFPIKLTIAMDNFYNVNNIPLLDKDFFKTLRDIKLDKSAKKLDKFIYNGFLVNLAEPGNHYKGAVIEFSFCSSYFSRCYAYSRKHNKVTINDIADGWILTFKLFLNDLRPYINGLEASSPCAPLPPQKPRKNINTEKKHVKYFYLKKIIAIILAIIAFCIFLSIVGFISNILNGTPYYHYPPSTRFAIFGVILMLTGKVYSLAKKFLKF